MKECAQKRKKSDAKTTTPKREAILQRAKELYAENEFKRGDAVLAESNPEPNELIEDGFYAQAQSELMRNPETKYLEDSWKSYNEQCEDFKFDTVEGMATTCFISGLRGTGKSDIAMNIVDLLTKEGVICLVFDGSLDWIRRSSIAKFLTVKPYSVLAVPEQNTILDISLLTPMEQQRTVESFCKKLFEFQLNSDKRFYVVFEEAQIYFPLNSIRAKNYQHTARLLTVGRNLGVSIAAISQFPSMVDCELRKHSGQVYIGYCSEPNTLAYWKGILGEKAQELKKLQNGEFVYYCRNAISKIYIEPYEGTTAKTTELKPIEPIQPIRQTTKDGKALKALILTGLWSAAIIYGLSQLLH